MNIKCPSCGHTFDPTKEKAREYSMIATRYPCPECGTQVPFPPFGGT